MRCSAEPSLTVAGTRRAARRKSVGHRHTGQDQHPAAGKPPGQLGGGGDAVGAGQADVQERDVRPVLQRGGHDLIADGQRRGHLDIVLQPEQRDERIPYLAGVLGHQHPDHGKPSIRSSLGHPGAVT